MNTARSLDMNKMTMLMVIQIFGRHLVPKIMAVQVQRKRNESIITKSGSTSTTWRWERTTTHGDMRCEKQALEKRYPI